MELENKLIEAAKELKLKLTIEEIETLQKLGEVMKNIADMINEVWKKIKKAIESIKEIFNSFIVLILKLPPRERYKLLKAMKVKNYEMFFKRDGVFRCRNNC